MCIGVFFFFFDVSGSTQNNLILGCGFHSDRETLF